MRRWLVLIAIAVCIALTLRLYVVEPAKVASGSMRPTLETGEQYIVDKISYRFRSPRRGEIIVFHSPLKSKQDIGLIKRVIAVGDDEVEIRHKQVWLNGQVLFEPYAVHSRARETLEGDNLGPLHVPPDQLFVLGDNRDESDDSSVWKDPETGKPIYFLPMRSVIGRLIQFF